jgi:hypothetical protein
VTAIYLEEYEMNSQDDEFLTILMAPFLLSIFGPTIAAKIFPQFSETLVSWHLLSTDGVIIAVADGIGLGLPQLLFAAAALLIVCAFGYVIFRRRRGRADQGRQAKGARA